MPRRTLAGPFRDVHMTKCVSLGNALPCSVAIHFKAEHDLQPCVSGIDKSVRDWFSLSCTARPVSDKLHLLRDRAGQM